MKFRCYVLASNEIDPEIARRRGISGFVEPATGLVLDIENIPTDKLRACVAKGLELRIEEARLFGFPQATLVLGHRSTWSDEDLIAVDLGLLDGSASLPARPIARGAQGLTTNKH